MVSAAVVIALQIACGTSPTAPTGKASPPQTFVSYTSEPGDFPGGGKSARLTLATAAFTPSVNDHFDAGIRQMIRLTIRPNDSSSTIWFLTLLSAVGRRLTVGRYENAERFPSAPDRPGLDFSPGGACNQSTGRFEILDVAYGSNQPIDRLHVTFEQRCTGSTAGLHGEAMILADPWR